MPSLSYDTDYDLNIERQSMRTFRRALNVVLSQRPTSDAPNIYGAFPDAPSLLKGVDLLAEFLGEYHPLSLARRDIIEYVRTHPDVGAFQSALGVSDEYIDQLFRDAIAVENASVIV